MEIELKKITRAKGRPKNSATASAHASYKKMAAILDLVGRYQKDEIRPKDKAPIRAILNQLNALPTDSEARGSLGWSVPGYYRMQVADFEKLKRHFQFAAKHKLTREQMQLRLKSEADGDAYAGLYAFHFIKAGTKRKLMTAHLHDFSRAIPHDKPSTLAYIAMDFLGVSRHDILTAKKMQTKQTAKPLVHLLRAIGYSDTAIESVMPILDLDEWDQLAAAPPLRAHQK